MSLKQVHAPHLGRSVKMGRSAPVARRSRLSLKNYLDLKALPPVPTASDLTAAAMDVLRDIMGNDSMGDCVIAGGYHIVGTETGNAGNLFHATMPQVIKDYSAIGGFDPNNPQATDNGCNEQTALDYWTQTGFANGTKLVTSVYVDGTNPQELMAACFLFENLMFGMPMPDAWVSPFPSGDDFVWAKAGDPNPQNGHCVVSPAAYDSAKGIRIATWGLLGWMTFDGIATYCVPSVGGEVHVAFTPDQLAKGQAKAPNGVAWSDLMSDIQALGGNVPPQPTPPAPPAPPGPAPSLVSLADAQQWACQGLAQNWPTGA